MRTEFRRMLIALGPVAGGSWNCSVAHKGHCICTCDKLSELTAMIAMRIIPNLLFIFLYLLCNLALVGWEIKGFLGLF